MSQPPRQTAWTASIAACARSRASGSGSSSRRWTRATPSACPPAVPSCSASTTRTTSSTPCWWAACCAARSTTWPPPRCSAIRWWPASSSPAAPSPSIASRTIRQDGQERRRLRRVLHAFEPGRLVAIYPEGTTHAEARVQRIKTGAARIALEYEAEPARAPYGDPGRADLRRAQVVPRPRAGLLRRGDPARRLPARLPRGSGEGGRGAHARSSGAWRPRSSTSSASTTSGWCARWRSSTATT